jgi:hypothetical protein
VVGTSGDTPVHHVVFFMPYICRARVTKPVAAGILQVLVAARTAFLSSQEEVQAAAQMAVKHHCLRLSDAAAVKKHLVHTAAKGTIKS